MHAELEQLLGDGAQSLLQHHCKTIPKERLHLPGPDFVDRVYAQTDRHASVLRSLAQIFNHGRLAVTVICPSCRWTRASSTPPARVSRPIRIISTRRTSCDLPSKAAATPWPPHSVSSARSPANTPTGFHFSSSSIITNS